MASTTGSNQYRSRPGANPSGPGAGLLSQVAAGPDELRQAVDRTKFAMFERLAGAPEPVLLWSLEQPDLPEPLRHQICGRLVRGTTEFGTFRRVVTEHRPYTQDPDIARATILWAVRGYYRRPGELAGTLLGLPRCGPEPIAEAIRRWPQTAEQLQAHPCWSAQADRQLQKYQRSERSQWDQLLVEHPECGQYKIIDSWNTLGRELQDRWAACVPLRLAADLLGEFRLSLTSFRPPEFTQHQLDLIWQRPSRNKPTVAKTRILQHYGKQGAIGPFAERVPQAFWEDLARMNDGDQVWKAAVRRPDCPAEVLTSVLRQSKLPEVRAEALRHRNLPAHVRAMAQLVL
jgi:hypothetical protein